MNTVFFRLVDKIRKYLPNVTFVTNLPIFVWYFCHHKSINYEKNQILSHRFVIFYIVPLC